MIFKEIKLEKLNFSSFVHATRDLSPYLIKLKNGIYTENVAIHHVVINSPILTGQLKVSKQSCLKVY